MDDISARPFCSELTPRAASEEVEDVEVGVGDEEEVEDVEVPTFL